MFDVHILSINVGIHYISVLIKYFFSRGKWLCLYVYVWKRLCVYVKICSSETQSVLLQRHNIHVTGNTYVMADL